MPVVSKREFRLPAQFGGRQHMKINFTAKTGNFFIVLPDVMASALHMKNIEDPSMEGVAKKFQEVIKHFEAKKTIKTKVIVLWINTYHRDEEDEEIDGDDHRITFDMIVCSEYKFGDKNPSYMTIPVSSDEQEKKIGGWHQSVIPWTEEREKALMLVREKFCQFADILHELFGPVMESESRWSKSEDYKKTTLLIIRSIDSGAYKKILELK